MKKNGFTLIELLAVITILAITATIVIVKIDKNIKDSQDFADDMQIKNIENAALTYSSTYIDEIVDFNTKKVGTITVSTLIDKGILKKKDVDSIPVEEWLNHGWYFICDTCGAEIEDVADFHVNSKGYCCKKCFNWVESGRENRNRLRNLL